MQMQLEATDSFSFMRNNVIQFLLAFAVGARVGINIQRELYNARGGLFSMDLTRVSSSRGGCLPLILIHVA